MSTYKIFLSGLATIIGAFIILSFIKPKSAIKTTAANSSFAVVELYTSEGCSSCPPADELVSKIQKENNSQVYILAFHVDYWNRLGWKDVFSNAEYSNRQNDYAHYLKTSSVYTPQIVVNGKKEFIGSQEGNLRSAIKSALSKEAQAKLLLSNVQASNKKASVSYALEGNLINNNLLLALVERSAKNVIKAGENSGRTLSHVQIVRDLQTVSINKGKSGTANLTLPNGFNAQNFEIIGLLQNTVTGEITGATRSVIVPAI
ncbi:thioredoxin family protein [Mucilaginibacter puniceus]